MRSKKQTTNIKSKLRSAKQNNPTNPDVLWLLPDGFTRNRESYATKRLIAHKFNAERVVWTSVHKNVKGIWALKGKSKTLKHTPPKEMPKLLSYIHRLLEHTKPEVVVINDVCAGFALFPDFFTKPKLQTFRGSKLKLARYPNIDFIVVDDVVKCYMPFETERINTDTYAWIFDRDLKKVIRHANKTQLSQRPLEYKLVERISELRNARDWLLRKSFCVSVDAETSGATITCISVVGMSHDGLDVRGWTFPVFAGYIEDGIFWPDVKDELNGWLILKEILESPLPKIAQNGVYDIQYLFKYGIDVKNFICDTQILMHSFCGTMEKGLGFLASLFLDDYVFWKDEIKGDGTTNDTDKTGTRVPLSRHGCEIYWEYCAKDSYNTLYVALRLLPFVVSLRWAGENYVRSLMLQHGPMLQASMTGLKLDLSRRERLNEALWQMTHEAKKRFHTAIADPHMNPRSPAQLKELFFDILNVKPLKGQKRTTQEKALRRMCVRHPIADVIQRFLTDYKRPSKLIEYVNIRPYKGRFMYSLNAVGTWTGRASSSKHAYWVGGNAQNMSKKVRSMMVADEGYWIVPIDYSQSDGYFVAFESQDERYVKNMYKNMNEGFDTHAFHVELLLGTNYDEVIKGKKAKDPAIVHPVTGSRSIIKRVVHGKNYDMKKNTMLTTVGVISIIRAAITVGWKDAHTWLDPKLEHFTHWLGMKYDKYYSRVGEWKDELLTEVAKNKGTLKAYGGRTHYVIGNPMRDTTGRIKRQTSAFKGQGGTAGNINRTCIEFYYDTHYLPTSAEDAIAAKKGQVADLVKTHMYKHGVIIYNQVHDEVVWGVPFGKEYLIDNLLAIMEKPITLNGREFYVPCEAELGLSWSNLIDWEGYSDEKDFHYYYAKAKAKERAYDKALNEKGLKL